MARLLGKDQNRPHDIPGGETTTTWIRWLARFGYAAKGVVYIIVGILALQAAAGTGGQTTGAQGALQTIVAHPFGRVILVIIAVGLLGYTLWRFVEAILDPEDKGTDPKGIAQRLSYITSGLVYASIALAAINIVTGSGGSAGDSQAPEDWTARLLMLPFGKALVILIGLLLIGFAISEFYRAYQAEFMERFNTWQMGASEEKWIKWLGRLGLTARGVVYTILGVFLVQAALRHDPARAGGLGDALDALARQPYGWIILGVVAAGLVAYGVYSIAKARYRVIHPN